MSRFVVRRRPLVGASLLALLAGMWLPSIVLPTAGATTVAGFEVDGNATNNGGADWADVKTVPDAIDNVPELSVISASSKEDDLPSSWKSAGGLPKKTDIVATWGYAHNTAGDTYVDFAWTRKGTTGTGGFYLELDKLPNAVNSHGVDAPVRSDGDVRLEVKQTGNASLSLQDVATWAWSSPAHVAGSWTTAPSFVPGSSTGYDYAVNTSPLTPPGGTLTAADGFVEASFDLTTLLGVEPSCAGAFGTANFRAFTGNSDKNLEDYIHGFGLKVGATCSSLTVLKKTNVDGQPGSALGGATFRITPNPLPGGSGAFLDVLDNGANDASSAAGTVSINPALSGTYSVQEVGAPGGYLIDNTNPVTGIQAPAGGDAAPVTFTDTAVRTGLSLVKSTTTASYSTVGDEISYSYAVTNTGNVPLTTIAVTDDKIDTVDCSGVSSPLLPGAEGTCTATYDVVQPDLDRGFVTNHATAAGHYGDTLVSSAESHVTVDAAGEGAPVLSIVKTAIPASGATVQPGGTITYTLTVSNSGNHAAQGVQLVDTLPAHVTVVGGSASPEPSSASATELDWSVDVPAAVDGTDGSTTVSYAVTVEGDAPQGATLTNSVVMGNHSSSTSHTVATGSLSLVKHVDQTAAQYLDTLTYSFDAAATGALDQHAVVVTDVVPDGVTYVEGSAACTDTGDCSTAYDDSTRTVTFALGTLAAGDVRHVRFQATVDKPVPASDGSIPGRTVTDVGHVSSTETPSTASNPVSTDIGAVLGVTVTRRPPTHPGTAGTPTPSRLPFSGAPVPPAASLALSLILLCAGGLLLIGRKPQLHG